MKRGNSETEQPAKKAKNSNISDEPRGFSTAGKMPAIPSPAEIQKRLEAARAKVQSTLPTKSDQVTYDFSFIEAF
jgi:hypothetical protein